MLYLGEFWAICVQKKSRLVRFKPIFDSDHWFDGSELIVQSTGVSPKEDFAEIKTVGLPAGQCPTCTELSYCSTRYDMYYCTVIVGCDQLSQSLRKLSK